MTAHRTSDITSADTVVDWRQVDAVLLDMDGTLLDLRFDDFFWGEYLPRRFAEHRGLDLATARQLMRPWFRAVEGTLDWYCLDYWHDRLGLDLLALKHEVADMIAVLPHVPEFLARVRAAGRRLVLTTNAHPASLELKFSRTGIDTYFDRLVSSHEFGVAKESPGFWQRLCAEEDIGAGRALFVDDSPAVLQSARAFGVGQVLAMCAPDSLGTRREIPGFTGIDDFREITGELEMMTCHYSDVVD